MGQSLLDWEKKNSKWKEVHGGVARQLVEEAGWAVGSFLAAGVLLKLGHWVSCLGSENRSGDVWRFYLKNKCSLLLKSCVKVQDSIISVPSFRDSRYVFS